MPFTIAWLDFGRGPKDEPNPDYPAGIDMDASMGQVPSCWTEVSYPAKRCGAYIVQCDECLANVAVTTAGRVDDPRSVRLACRQPKLPAPPV